MDYRWKRLILSEWESTNVFSQQNRKLSLYNMFSAWKAARIYNVNDISRSKELFNCHEKQVGTLARCHFF
ncbi:hypothetical protein QE152_g22564 [Popillia japonica]|uniref:Uncharacterized protein n=1 Tax=Popillia japonica TaxID=7064 RepID=A0AAW1KKE7_POPJA